jgi:hypothetical protein
MRAVEYTLIDTKGNEEILGELRVENTELQI